MCVCVYICNRFILMEARQKLEIQIIRPVHILNEAI